MTNSQPPHQNTTAPHHYTTTPPNSPPPPFPHRIAAPSRSMDVGRCLLAGCPCQHGHCSLQTHRAPDNTLYYTFFPCASCLHSFEQHSAPIGPDTVPVPAPDTAISIVSREKRRRLSDHPRTPRRPVYSRAHVPNVPGSPSRPQGS